MPVCTCAVPKAVCVGCIRMCNHVLPFCNNIIGAHIRRLQQSEQLHAQDPPTLPTFSSRKETTTRLKILHSELSLIFFTAGPVDPTSWLNVYVPPKVWMNKTIVMSKCMIKILNFVWHGPLHLGGAAL